MMKTNRKGGPVMRTKLYPVVQICKGTWEIDEFDCASMFLLEGTERALLIDCGLGIGDLRGAVEQLTDKPVTLVISHGHGDHIGNIDQFDEIWIHPADRAMLHSRSVEKSRSDITKIARRQKGSLGGVYTLFNLYPFDLDTDLREWERIPEIHDLTDGMEFDLGDRVVTVYECAGHTGGEVVFLDSRTRTLFCGDALNYNLLILTETGETALHGLKRLRDLSDRYDRIFNGHHDFRALGAPLDGDCLPNAIALLEDAVAGHWSPCQMPSFWGQDMPITRTPQPQLGPDGKPITRVTLHRGRNFISIDPDRMKE